MLAHREACCLCGKKILTMHTLQRRRYKTLPRPSSAESRCSLYAVAVAPKGTSHCIPMWSVQSPKCFQVFETFNILQVIYCFSPRTNREWDSLTVHRSCKLYQVFRTQRIQRIGMQAVEGPLWIKCSLVQLYIQSAKLGS